MQISPRKFTLKVCGLVALAVCGVVCMSSYYGFSVINPERRFLKDVFDSSLEELACIRGLAYTGHGVKKAESGKFARLSLDLSISRPLRIEEARPLAVHVQNCFIGSINSHPKAEEFMDVVPVTTETAPITIYIDGVDEEKELVPYLQVVGLRGGKVVYLAKTTEELGPFDYSFSESWEEAVRIVEGESGCNAD